MDVSGPEFPICFKSLLAWVVEMLGYLPPIYHKGIPSDKTYFVVVLGASSPKAYYFQGSEQGTLLRSQKDAALKAIRFLAKKHAFEIKDINYDQTCMYKKCADFYEMRARELESTLGLPERPQPNHSNQVQPSFNFELDFLEVLIHIMGKVGIPMGDVDIMPAESDLFQACIELKYPTGTETSQYVLGDIFSSAAEATNDVAKKALFQLQSDFKFTVRDVNFEPMVQAWLRCSANQKKCTLLQAEIATKKEANGAAANELALVQLANWSPGPLGTIKTSRNAPPLPPRKRKFHIEPAPESKLGTSSSIPREVADT